MRNLRQQWIGAYLALCLVLAGFVGRNPWLHRLVDHGGAGAEHVHQGGVILWHDHGDGHPHTHALPAETVVATSTQDEGLRDVFQRHPFGELPLSRLFQWLSQRWQATGGSPDPHPFHQHHGLTQMLVDGVVEDTPTWVPLFCPPKAVPDREGRPRCVPPEFPWFPQAAGRAPPHRVRLSPSS